MIKKAFKMKLFPGNRAEYKKRHDLIWPELVEVLKQHGAKTYSIFLDEETNILFSYIEMDNAEDWNKVSETEVCKKWWDFMKDIMDTNEDNSPVSIELCNVFDLK